MRPRRSVTVNRKIVAAVLCGGVAGATAYVVPTAAEAAPDVAPALLATPGHHLSTRLRDLVAADEANLSAVATAHELSLPVTGAGSLLRAPDGQRLVVDVRMSSYGPDRVAAVESAGGQIINDNPAY